MEILRQREILITICKVYTESIMLGCGCPFVTSFKITCMYMYIELSLCTLQWFINIINLVSHFCKEILLLSSISLRRMTVDIFDKAKPFRLKIEQPQPVSVLFITSKPFHLPGFRGRALWADCVNLRMNTIASRDQFKPIRAGENLVVNYNDEQFVGGFFEIARIAIFFFSGGHQQRF